MLLETRESKIILDCGLNLSAKDSLGALPRFDITGIGMEDVDAVVLSHAHLDHTGFLPALFKYGYRGPVYCTEPTLLLMSILQRDYLKYSGSDALYSEQDIDRAVTHTITLKLGTHHRIDFDSSAHWERRAQPRIYKRYEVWQDANT
jgi:predicted metal-dependent RNase